MIALPTKAEIVFHFQSNFHFDKSDVRYFFHTIYLALLFIQLFSNDKSNSISFTKVCVVPICWNQKWFIACKKKKKTSVY